MRLRSTISVNSLFGLLMAVAALLMIPGGIQAKSAYQEIGYEEFHRLAGSQGSDHASEVRRVERIAFEIYDSTAILTRSHARNWRIEDDRGSASFTANDEERRGRLILLMKLGGDRYKSVSDWNMIGGGGKWSKKEWERIEQTSRPSTSPDPPQSD
jgi:hypothetical protein